MDKTIENFLIPDQKSGWILRLGLVVACIHAVVQPIIEIIGTYVGILISVLFIFPLESNGVIPTPLFFHQFLFQTPLLAINIGVFIIVFITMILVIRYYEQKSFVFEFEPIRLSIIMVLFTTAGFIVGKVIYHIFFMMFYPGGVINARSVTGSHISWTLGLYEIFQLPAELITDFRTIIISVFLVLMVLGYYHYVKSAQKMS
ncbi:MAG: hypothetical protein ACFFAU_13425 [Candidatus Hodarchaeota archaeon]